MASPIPRHGEIGPFLIVDFQNPYTRRDPHNEPINRTPAGAYPLGACWLMRPGKLWFLHSNPYPASGIAELGPETQRRRRFRPRYPVLQPKCPTRTPAPSAPVPTRYPLEGATLRPTPCPARAGTRGPHTCSLPAISPCTPTPRGVHVTLAHMPEGGPPAPREGRTPRVQPLAYNAPKFIGREVLERYSPSSDSPEVQGVAV